MPLTPTELQEARLEREQAAGQQHQAETTLQLEQAAGQGAPEQRAPQLELEQAAGRRAVAR